MEINETLLRQIIEEVTMRALGIRHLGGGVPKPSWSGRSPDTLLV
ncbi:hypothetical protein [Klebsiella pneumoniae]